MFPTTTQDRRRSWNSLTTTESWRPRSASTGVIEISPFNRNVSSGQRTPATPCFVSPRMAFSTQFNYDSPIQVLTSSSPCVFQPMSVRRLKKRCSLSRLPPRCKILLIVLCLSFTGSLYFIRSLKGNETPLPCIGENCNDLPHDHPSLQRFLGTVNQQQQQPHHSLTQDLDNPNVELPNAPSLNNDFQYYETTGYQPNSIDGNPNEAERHHMKNAIQNKPGRVSGVYIESNRPENPVNSTTDLGPDTLLHHQPNGLEVQSIPTLEDLPLVQPSLDHMMPERERRDLTTDNRVVQQETTTFQAYLGPEESQFADPQNGRREETVYVNSPNVQDEAIRIYSNQHRPETDLNAIPHNPQGENLYFYAQNGNQMGNSITGPQRRFEDSSNFHSQNVQTGQENRQPQLSEREIEARMTRHYIPKENNGEVLQHSMDRAYPESRPMQAGYRSGDMPYMRNEHFMYDEPPMDRFPPGVNPRRYRNEF